GMVLIGYVDSNDFGSHSITFTARDGAGNSAQHTVTVSRRPSPDHWDGIGASIVFHQPGQADGPDAIIPLNNNWDAQHIDLAGNKLADNAPDADGVYRINPNDPDLAH